MAANSALITSDLDFDLIRANLAAFLKNQTQFKDYDYDGSNISVLLDLLSYNTHLNSFYTNMAISESFLDSAQIRDSVVSRAKELNYTPRSAKSATAYVNITISPEDSPPTISIPKGTIFTSRMDNQLFTFTTDSNYIVNADTYTAANVAIYEGVYVSETFLFDSSIEGQRFILNSNNVDTSSVSVEVYESGLQSNYDEYLFAQSLLGLDQNSKVFFIQAASNNKYEIVFGDRISGKSPVNGNTIKVTYRVTKGPLANRATNFKLASSISGYPTSSVSVTTVQSAFGGSDSESIQSIKFNAPRHYQIQERAVTDDDYKTILFQRYPTVRAVNVYGGESLPTPQFGRVFISLDFDEYDGIPEMIKEDIVSFINSKNPTSIQPVVVDPDYTYINVECNILYNVNNTSKSASDIENTVFVAVKDFNDEYLNDFKLTFRYSKLVAAIDNSDQSIVSTNLTTKLIKQISPTVGSTYSTVFDYQNEITPGSITSTQFTYSNAISYLKDDSSGKINIATMETGVEKILKYNVGSMNYSTGRVSLNLPAIQAYSTNVIKIYAKPILFDNVAINNNILSILDEDINVVARAIRE